jgi:hypothetical protein
MGEARGVPTRGDLAQPQVKKTPQSSLQVTDSLAKDPDFIKVECHIGKYITAMVNTEAEQVDIQALHSDLDYVLLHINVRYPFSCVRLPFAS